jgi:hypothetical protein
MIVLLLSMCSILEREFVHELKELENDSIALEDKISNAKHAKVMNSTLTCTLQRQ